MVKVISYKIRFPLGATFQKDPEAIFLKKIFSEIKTCTCINKEFCSNCTKTSKCIYHLLSGEDFEKYPSIGVIRNPINKRTYTKNDVFTLTFFLIGIATNYSDFITSYMDSEEYVAGFYFQKVIDKNIIYHSNSEYYNGKIKFLNIIKDENDIIDSINYYNNKYKCTFLIPTFATSLKNVHFKDKTFYKFSDKHICLEGNIRELYVENFSVTFFKIGLGKYNFLGGGTSKCE